jgi:biotin carboxylase
MGIGSQVVCGIMTSFCWDVGYVFAFGETRAMAIANMVLGLKELHIRGEIRTNVDYTVYILHVSAGIMVTSLNLILLKCF